MHDGTTILYMQGREPLLIISLERGKVDIAKYLIDQGDYVGSYPRVSSFFFPPLTISVCKWMTGVRITL